MSEKRFSVRCTGRGAHGRITWPDLILADDDTLREGPTRLAPLAAGQSRRKALIRAESHRTRNESWHWRCPRCGIDRPLTEDHLRAWMKTQSSGVLDISLLPRYLPR